MPDRDDYDEIPPMGKSCEMSYERFGVVMADAAYEAVKAENERLREALCAAGLAPGVVDVIARGEPPRPCPAGHGSQCCGYPVACEAAQSGSSAAEGAE